MADPGDIRARDLAADSLVRCRTFLAAAQDRLLWGGCDPVKGFDPLTYNLTEFEPLVWLRLYASTIMLASAHEIRKEGPYTILEMKAKFRSKLDPGEYPYPFWHSAKKWQAYLNLKSLAVVFQDDRIVAAYRIASESITAAEQRPWDGQWHWEDANGQEQPRVALFSYMFSADNPHRAQVEQAYRTLEAQFRAQTCTACHAPDNKGKSKALLMLNYPNQSLVSRHKLVQVLMENQMPPADEENGHPAGIPDKAKRDEIVKLARRFAAEADAAVGYQKAHDLSREPNRN